jgi:hypothetical protein
MWKMGCWFFKLADFGLLELVGMEKDENGQH